MGMFSSWFGGGGSAKRAAQVAASAAAKSRADIGEAAEEFGAYYDPYRQAGQAAIGGQQAALTDVTGRISAIDPRIAGLREQQAALQPQVSEMYTLAQQQDPILAQIQSGDIDAYQRTPGYEFRRQEGLRALEQSAAARGGLFSGQTGRELERYGQGVATSEYDRYMSGLYNQLGAVSTQLGGRQAALGAGQQQIAGGVSLLGQDFKQIAAQMGVSDAYQNLISQGLSAAGAAARLGMGAAGVQSGLTQEIGQTYASGMQAKAKQMSAAGDQWVQLGAMAAGGVMGGAGMLGAGVGALKGAQAFGGMAPQFAGVGQQQFGGGQALALGGQQPIGQPQARAGTQAGALGQDYALPAPISYGQPQVGVSMPQGPYQQAQLGQDPNLRGGLQRQAERRFETSFNRGFA